VPTHLRDHDRIDKSLGCYLYGLNLLADCTQHILAQSVKLIKAAPSSALHQSYENAAHCSEIKLLIAIEN
jgi:hypothetical protein